MENKIELINGTSIIAYPNENVANGQIDNDLQLDTTGQYFSLGKRKPISTKSQSIDPEKELFLKNAFFFLANADKIMKDSRMFLAPVPVQSGLAYTGTGGFRNPTLGVYIEWWLNYPFTMMEERGSKRLTYHIAGSPLSGMNHCGTVDEDGNTHTYSFPSPFNRVWRSFMDINTRYDEAKTKYAAFTLQEVACLLREEENAVATPFIINSLFLRGKVATLTDTVKRLTEENNDLQKQLSKSKIKLHEEPLRQLYDRYISYRQVQNLYLEELYRTRLDLRKQLKNGQINTKDYQPKMKDLNRKIQEQRYETYPDFVNETSTFGISFGEVIKFFEAENK